MRFSFRQLTTALCMLFGLWLAPAQAAERHIRGVVSDESKGVLPGVVVVATAADGEIAGSAVTDRSGQYAIGPLPPGRVRLTFQLEGFSSVAVTVTVGADTDAVINQRLVVAPRSETVEVVGRMPVPPPPPPPPPAPRPKHVTVAVPEHDRDSVCGPAKLGPMPESVGTVRARRYAANGLYSAGDELVIDSGTLSGLEVGRNLVVRRTYRVEWEPRSDIGEHTAGLVQVVSADEYTAVAVVIYACDEILPGDRLASFTAEPIRTPAPPGRPDIKRAVKILFPGFGQSLGAPRRMLVIDGGAASGHRVGQRVTLFRRRLSDGKPSFVGDAVVVAVRSDSATIRVEHVTDAIFSGDWAAPQR